MIPMRIPTHPGAILKEELQACGLSAHRFALDLGVPPNRITEILNGKRSVTAETALRLATYFGNSAQFWMNLQSNHDLGVAQNAHGKEIKRTVRKAA
jgi:addiction module HigA family antidote